MTKVLDILLPVIGSGLLLALIIVMVRRKLHREYPFFSLYAASVLVITICRTAVSGDSKTYFYVYWITDGFLALLALLALNETFHRVFRGFCSFWWFRLIFPALVAVISFLEIREAILKPFARMPLFAWITASFESALSLIQVGVLLAFLVLALGLRVHWRRYPFYIALGFAISGAGDWMSHAILSEFGNKFFLIIRYVPPATYICATLIWVSSFSGKFVSQPELKWDMMPRRSRRSDPARTEIKNRSFY